MGNSGSQPCRRKTRSGPMYLFYLLQRTFTGKTERVDKEDRDETGDRESELFSSQCTDCRNCHYRQDSLTFDSESEMAPNAEEELLAVKPWGPKPEKERLRPPTYNAEDYAIALRRWGRRPVVTSQHESHGTLPSTTSSSSGYASGSGEMTLRQFTSVSELLNKLRADLRLAFPSFVQEFASPPADGMTLLLETLRGVQLIQSSPPNGQGGPRVGTRRAALDELGCVECLAACGERCPDAPRLLSQAQPGLLALAVCLTSSLNRSRVLALQLLTKVCQAPGGHLAVSEAVSILRLRYGEGGRFRFLAGALLAPSAAIALRVAGVAFLNAFLKSAPRTQTRLYIQAEACEAGLEPRVLQSWLQEVDVRSDDTLAELLHMEVQKWSHNCVDVEALQKRLARAEEACTILGNKVSILQEQLDKYSNTVKINSYASSSVDQKSKDSSMSEHAKIMQQGISSNGEDEGINSSERSSSPEVLERSVRQSESNKTTIDNDQETTIDDVIEELRIIVKDAEEEYEDRKGNVTKSFSDLKIENLSSNMEKQGTRTSIKSVNREATEPVTYFGSNEDEHSVDSAITRKLSSSCSERMTKNCNDASVKIIVKNPEFEDAIVPAILYPQPPRRAPPCLSNILSTRDTDFLDSRIIFDHQQDEEDIEEETLGDGSDSLLSASRLKYITKTETVDGPANLETDNFYQTDINVASSNYPRNVHEKSQRDPTSRCRELKTIRNFDNATNLKNLQDSDPTNKYLQVYQQFESTSKSNNENSNAPKRSTSRYKNEMEKRKLLRRSASQDFLGSNDSSLSSGKSKIEGHIRKFESMNAFASPRKSRMKRSESFHHVSMTDKEEKSMKRDAGGSDSGLVYITDYDLEPLVNHKNLRDSFPGFAHLLTKSLNQINEDCDSMFDARVSSSKRVQHSRSSKDSKTSKSRNDEKTLLKSKLGGLKNCARKSSNSEKNLKRDDEAIDSFGKAKLLRSDEFYDETMRIGRQWNFQNDLEGYRKTKNFPGNVNSMTMIVTSPNALRHDKIVNKFSSNDSGVFLPSGRYDAFGKNRCNAGKYFGHSTQGRDNNNVGVRKNSTASLVAKRGKVTDIISGLY